MIATETPTDSRLRVRNLPRQGMFLAWKATIGMVNMRRTQMKRFAVVAATVLSVAFGAQALAQQIAVEVAPDTRTTIKEYVVKEKIRPVTVKERVTVGAILPTEVQLQPAPTAWGPSVSKYHYVYADNHVVLVEPSSRKVVQIID